VPATRTIVVSIGISSPPTVESPLSGGGGGTGSNSARTRLRLAIELVPGSQKTLPVIGSISNDMLKSGGSGISCRTHTSLNPTPPTDPENSVSIPFAHYFV